MTRWQSMAAIMAADLPAIDHVVPDLLPVGLTLLVGGSKLGKSYLAQNIATAISSGGTILDRHVGEPGAVLYLDFELGPRRVKARMEQAFPSAGNRPDLSRFFITDPADTIPKIGPKLDEFFDSWRASVARPRLIIIDVYQDVAPAKKGGQNAYEADSDHLRPLQRYANMHGIGVLILHHPRKGAEGDPLESGSGSIAMASKSNNVLAMRKQGKATTLYMRGHDIEERVLAIDLREGWWHLLGDAERVVGSEQRRAVIEAVKKYGPATPLQVSDETGLSRAAVRKMLNRMDKAAVAGEPVALGNGKYVIKDSSVTASLKSVAAIEKTPVTSSLSQQNEESHSVTSPVTSSVSVTSAADENVTEESHSTDTDSSDSVTSDTKSDYLLRWMVNNHAVGDRITHRTAQQGTAPNLSGEDVRGIAPSLAAQGLIEIPEKTKDDLPAAYVLTKAGYESVKGPSLF